MRLLQLAVLLCTTTFSSFCHGQSAADEMPDFPRTDEIQRVVIQADRAIQLNHHCLLVFETLRSANEKDAVENDAKGVEMAAQILQKLRDDPDAFHAGMGLLLLTAIDDVSRNAALSANSLMADAVMAVATGGPKAKDAIERVDSSNTCLESSAFVYSVSETLSSLMVREVRAQNIQSAKEEKALANVLRLLDSENTKKGP